MPVVLGRFTRFFRDSDHIFFEEINTYEVLESQLRTDLEGAHGELGIIERRITEFRDRLPSLINDVDIKGTQDEITYMLERAERIKEFIRKMEEVLDTPLDGDIPDRSR